MNFLQLVERSAGDMVKLKIYRPSDSLDESAAIASEHFGLKPKTVVVDMVIGKEEREVFIRRVTSGTRTEKIDHFAPGLSVEYELVRAVPAQQRLKTGHRRGQDRRQCLGWHRLYHPQEFATLGSLAN